MGIPLCIFHIRKSMEEVNFLNPTLPKNILILIFYFAYDSVSSSVRSGGGVIIVAPTS